VAYTRMTRARARVCPWCLESFRPVTERMAFCCPQHASYACVLRAARKLGIVQPKESLAAWRADRLWPAK
jgi:hypothetical protein